MIEVSQLKRGDVTAFVLAARRLHKETDWAWVPFSSAALRKSVTNMLRRPDFCVLVAREEGEICGLLIGSVDSFIYSRTLIATDIEFVAESGGDELIEAFKSWAVGVGAKSIAMAVSSSGREAAKDRFFRKHGAERTGGLYCMRIGHE